MVAKVSRVSARAAATNAWLFQHEVTDFLQCAETEVGVRSLTGAMLEQAQAGVVGEPSYDFDANIVNAIGNVSRQRTAWRTLREMLRRGQDREVVVLNLLFGHVRYPDLLGFGDLAPIVHLTEIAEDARLEIANERAEKAMLRLEVTFPEAERQALIEKEIKRAQRRLTRYENRAYRRDDAIEGEARAWQRVERARSVGGVCAAGEIWQRWRARLEREEDLWASGENSLDESRDNLEKANIEERLIVRLLDELGRPALLRAKQGACAQADLEVGPREALRAFTTMNGPKKPDGKKNTDAYKAWQLLDAEHRAYVATVVFIATVQAGELRQRAFIAYGDARRAVTK